MNICLNRFHPLGHNNIPNLGARTIIKHFNMVQQPSVSSDGQRLRGNQKQQESLLITHLAGYNIVRYRTAQAMESLHVLPFFTGHCIPTSSNSHISRRIRGQACAQQIELVISNLRQPSTDILTGKPFQQFADVISSESRGCLDP